MFYFLLILVPRFITWLVMIVNSSVIMQGAQLCQYNYTIPTKSLKTWSRKRRLSFVGFSPQKCSLFSNHKEEKRKLKLKPINKQQNNKKQTNKKQTNKKTTHTHQVILFANLIFVMITTSRSLVTSCFVSSITNAKKSHSRCFAIGLRFQFNLTCKVTSGMVSGKLPVAYTLF